MPESVTIDDIQRIRVRETVSEIFTAVAQTHPAAVIAVGPEGQVWYHDPKAEARWGAPMDTPPTGWMGHYSILGCALRDLPLYRAWWDREEASATVALGADTGCFMKAAPLAAGGAIAFLYGSGA